MNQLPNNLNPERRNFLKLLLLGGGAFSLGLLGRSFKPVTKFFSGHSFEVNSSSAQVNPGASHRARRRSSLDASVRWPRG